jgi:cysteine desulfuration protein SufE
MDIDEIIENFEFLDDWDDRYKYLIELGGMLDPVADNQLVAQNKVQGCVSQVWLISDHDGGTDPIMKLRGASDAHIVSGLVAIALAIFNGKPASEVVATDEKAVFDRINLSEHITPQRSNGLKSLVNRIKSDAANALTA